MSPPLRTTLIHQSRGGVSPRATLTPVSPSPATHTVVRRWRSTEMVWQVECSSTRAVDSVASFTTPM